MKWEHVTMDFVTHLSRTPHGHDAVLGISKRPEARDPRPVLGPALPDGL